MLRHTLEVVNAGPGRPLVISPDPQVLELAKALNATTLSEIQTSLSEFDQTQGLNLALNAACLHLLKTFPDDQARVLILPADLPLLEPADIEALLTGGASSQAIIAPDLSNQGTNALRLNLPIAANFNFRFGENSFELHKEALQQANISYEISRQPAILYDLDYPADFENLPASLKEKFLS